VEALREFCWYEAATGVLVQTQIGVSLPLREHGGMAISLHGWTNSSVTPKANSHQDNGILKLKRFVLESLAR
jgi:hypothetical protein